MVMRTEQQAYELSRDRTMFEEHRWGVLREQSRDIAGPGCIVELGVARGGVLGFLALMHPDRNVYGYCRFDKGLTAPSAIDGPTFREGMLSDRPASEVADWLLAIGARNATLVSGDVLTTLPDQHEPVALAMVDLNLYEPTKRALEWLRDHAVPGCVVLLDDIAFSGVRAALDDSKLKYESVGYMAKVVMQ